MRRTLVMTLIGVDRPGLVRSVAELVVQHGGNWLESRMSRLGGQFAGILRVEVPDDKEPALVADLRSLQKTGLNVVVHPDDTKGEIEGGRNAVLSIVGQDRPGIVRQISQALADYGVNVEDLQTECGSAAMSGETLFKATARLRIPESCDTGKIRRELEKIAEDLIVEVGFSELPIADLKG